MTIYTLTCGRETVTCKQTASAFRKAKLLSRLNGCSQMEYSGTKMFFVRGERVPEYTYLAEKNKTKHKKKIANKVDKRILRNNLSFVMNNRTVLIHYKAFRSDMLFQFTHESVIDPDVTNLELLEIAFRQCNHVDGNEWISLDRYARTLRLRSMSVGDEITFIEAAKVTRYRCEGCGWQQVTQEP